MPRWRDCVSDDRYFKHILTTFHSLAEILATMDFAVRKSQWMQNKLDGIVNVRKRRMLHTRNFKPSYTHPHSKPTLGYREQEQKRPRQPVHVVECKNEPGLKGPKGMEMGIYCRELMAARERRDVEKD